MPPLMSSEAQAVVQVVCDGEVVVSKTGEIVGVSYYYDRRYYAADVDECRLLLERVGLGLGSSPRPWSRFCGVTRRSVEARVLGEPYFGEHDPPNCRRCYGEFHGDIPVEPDSPCPSEKDPFSS